MAFRQDLYWSNLPYKKKRHKRVKGIIDKTFLKNATFPYFLYTGTNDIDINRFYGDEQFCKKIRKKKSPINFFLYEPLSYYFQNHGYNLGFYSEFHSKNNNDINLRAEELDCLNEFAETLSKKITVNLCDYNIPIHFFELYNWLDLKTRDIFIRQASTVSPSNKNDPSLIKTKFWSANARYTIHRHIVMCYLSHFEGNYSWFFDAPCDWQKYTDWLEDLPYGFLEQGNKILIEKKFRLDKKPKTIQVSYLAGFEKPEIDFLQIEQDFDESYHESFCCVINETRFAQPSANFSEKTLYAIAMNRPFVMAAPPRTLEYLKKFGFKTFSNWWSEDYDQEQNHSLRMMKIFSVINQINSLRISELREMYREMLPIIKHNNKILQNLGKNADQLDAFAN